MNEELKEQISTLKADIDKMIEKSVKTHMDGGDISQFKTEIKNALDEYKVKQAKLELSIDTLDSRTQTQIPQNKSGDTVFGTIAKEIEKLSPQIEKSRKAPLSFKIDDVISKAVGDFGSGNVSNGGLTYPFAGPDIRPGVTVSPLYDNHIRPYLRQTQTSRDVIWHVKETATEGGFEPTAMGATKPQWDLDLSMAQSPVTKIAGYFRIPEEMIDDIPYLLGYLTTRGIEEYRNTEDQQLLYGTGSSYNLTGLFTAATDFDANGATVASANNYDVLVTAKQQLRAGNLIPRVIMVNPQDYTTMRLSKGTDGHYIFPVIPGTDRIAVDGTVIVDNNRVTVGDFLVADTAWFEIADRKGIEVRLFDQDRDNAIKNMVTCVIEARLGLPIYRTTALVKGTFSTAISSLSA